MRKSKESIFLICMAVVIIGYFVLLVLYKTDAISPNIDPVSKVVSTLTTLIAAVAFWLQFKRTERLNEANFIKDLNNQYITNKDMGYIEHQLELYFIQYSACLGNRKQLSQEEIGKIHLGIDLSRTSDDCQKMVNYLAYMECLAAVEGRNVLHLDVIDDLFSYRFFVAVNNPVVQENDFLPYKEYYEGVFRLSQKWVENHRKRGIAIPMEQFCLSEERLNAFKRGERIINVDVGKARASDNKYEIAECIYDIGRLFYPGAFGEDKASAAKAISRLIGMENSLLDYNNLLLARYNGKVCGVCLFLTDKCDWNDTEIKKRLGEGFFNEEREEEFDYVYEKYIKEVTEHNACDYDYVELVALGVDDGYRRKGFARKMLAELYKESGGKPIRLTAISENTAAIALYEDDGFIEVKDKKDIDGFAPKGCKPITCTVMERSASQQN